MTEKENVPTIDALIELPEPDDAQISPDGTHVAYVVQTPDWKQNEYVTQIWLASVVEEGEPRQLTFARQSSHTPRWSPDGRWLAFLSQREGDEHTQIYRLSPFGGEAERLTELETDVQVLDWSPDGETIAYVSPEAESEADKKRKETYGDYRVEDEDYERARLWLLRLSDKKCLQLTGSDNFHVVEFDWAPDNKRIAFHARPTPDFKDWVRGRIYVVDVDTLTVTALTAEGHQAPHWSPDGSQIAFSRLGANFYNNNQLCLMDAGNQKVRTIPTTFDENMNLIAWGPGGLYFHAVQGPTIHLFRLQPDSGDIDQLTPDRPGDWASMGASFSADSTHLALVVSDASHHLEVTVLDRETGSVQHLTDFSSQIEGWQLAQPERFQWTSHDGTPIEGILTRPVDFDPGKKYPLLVAIHGGPAWVSLQTITSGYDRRLYPLPLWVAKGAITLQPNYRGSTGFGEAFRALNVRNLGVGDYEDIISGVDALIEEGWVDADRVGAMGWSQGGYISAFISTNSDRFQAVSVGAGVSNWVTYYANTDIHPFTRHYLGATPWEEISVYEKTSPMTYIQQAQTPTLIQHGEKDRRVPVPNAYELYQGLQDMGVEVRLVVYPGMPHGPDKPRQSRQIMQDNLDWFNRWIWGEEPDAQAERPCYVVLASAMQRENAEDLPAVQRYTADRIQDVYHWARRDQADFRIFSGHHGLLPPDEPTPPDEQYELAAAAVSDMAAQVAAQLESRSWSKLVLYTAEVEKRPSALIALGCLQVAAGIVGDVMVEHKSLVEDE